MWIEDQKAGIRLRVESEGPDDGPPVVLLHGMSSTRGYVLLGGSSHLARAGLRVISYDVRGHGESPRAPDPTAYAYEDLDGDLELVLDELGVERALFVGVSMGAHSALRLALRSPERVAGVGIITPGFDPENFGKPEFLAYCDFLEELLRESADAFATRYPLPPDVVGTREKALRYLIRQRLRGHRDLEAVADGLHAIARSAPYESLEELSPIDVPTLVVGTSTVDDPDHPFDLARRYAAALPGSRFETEAPDQRPLAWRGGLLSDLVMELAVEAGLDPAFTPSGG